MHSWVVGKALAWSWRRLTPVQRTTFLYERRCELLATLTPLQCLHDLEAVLTPAERVVVANGLIYGLPQKSDPYVY
jgi:hypothetical protein